MSHLITLHRFRTVLPSIFGRKKKREKLEWILKTNVIFKMQTAAVVGSKGISLHANVQKIFMTNNSMRILNAVYLFVAHSQAHNLTGFCTFHFRIVYGFFVVVVVACVHFHHNFPYRFPSVLLHIYCYD